MSSFDQEHYERIRQQQLDCEEAKSRWQDLKERASDAKKLYESRRDDLFRFIGDESDEDRPLLQGVGATDDRGKDSSPDASPVAPPDWQKLSLEFLEGIKDADRGKLIAADMTTLGDLQKRIIEHGESWHVGVDGVGLKLRDTIQAAFNEAIKRPLTTGTVKANGKDVASGKAVKKTPVKKGAKKKATKKTTKK